MSILIIGATGRVAAQLTRHLLDAREPVRLLVRNADKARASFAGANTANLELVAGAFDDPAVLQRAFTGVRAAFQGLGTSPQQVALEAGLIDAATRAGLPQLIRLSVLGADRAASY